MPTPRHSPTTEKQFPMNVGRPRTNLLLPYVRLFVPVAFLLASTLSLPPALAFDYDEHRQVVCDALGELCVPSTQDGKPVGLGTDVERLLCTYHCRLPHGMKTVASRSSTLECIGFADLVGIAGDYTRRPADLLEANCTELHDISVDIRSYLHLAEENVDHFRPNSENAYDHWHQLALAKAFAAKSTEDPELLVESLTYEAFALHFLTDSYSAGHQRVNRAYVREFVAKRLHDRDGDDGVLTAQGYKLQGDGKLLQASALTQRKAIVANAKASICQVVLSYDDQKPPACQVSQTADRAQFAATNLHPFSPYDETVHFNFGISPVMEIRRFYGARPQVYLNATVPWWPRWQVTVTYTPIAFVNQGAGDNFNRHTTWTQHQIEPGILFRQWVWSSKHDLLAEVRYPLVLSASRFRNYPTILVGMDYWVYVANFGIRFGAAQFPSLESGYRFSLFASLVAGVGF
jgi:hypothetical protein